MFKWPNAKNSGFFLVGSQSSQTFFNVHPIYIHNCLSVHVCMHIHVYISACTFVCVYMYKISVCINIYFTVLRYYGHKTNVHFKKINIKNK